MGTATSFSEWYTQNRPELIKRIQRQFDPEFTERPRVMEVGPLAEFWPPPNQQWAWLEATTADIDAVVAIRHPSQQQTDWDGWLIQLATHIYLLRCWLTLKRTKLIGLKGIQKADADDFLQEAYLKALAAIRNNRLFDGFPEDLDPTRWNAWFNGILSHVISDGWRRRKRLKPLSEDPQAYIDDSNSHSLLDQRWRDVIVKAIGELPDPIDREIAKGKHAGVSQRNIAERLELSEADVSRRWARIRRELRGLILQEVGWDCDAYQALRSVNWLED